MSFIRNALPRRTSNQPRQNGQEQQQQQQQPQGLPEHDIYSPGNSSLYQGNDPSTAFSRSSSEASFNLHSTSSTRLNKASMYSKDLPPAPESLNSAPTSSSISSSINSTTPTPSNSRKPRNFKKLSLPPSLSANPRQTSYKVLPVEAKSAISNSVNAIPAPEITSGSNTKVFCIEARETLQQDTSTKNGLLTNDDDLISQFSTLELNVEFKLDLRAEDIKVLSELGSGNGGTVSKAQHIPTGLIMARKVIPIEAKKEVRKQIVRELHIMHDCNFPHIVSYYGAFLNEGDVVMCMEYMDKKSLDRISKKYGPISESIIGKITEAVVEGLDYLYEQHRIIHRDVKPSNVLVNSQGQIKLCDFGVSGELNNSIADTFVGTSTYMSPERIQGAAYSVKSDVWSLGITLLELAIGYFPWDEANEDGSKPSASSHPMGILDMLQRIVLEPPPKLPANGNFTDHFRTFINQCLLTEDQRPTPKDLFKDAFFIISKQTPVALDKWAQQL